MPMNPVHPSNILSILALSATALVAVGCIQDPDAMSADSPPDAGTAEDADDVDDDADDDWNVEDPDCRQDLTWCSEAADGTGRCVDTDTDPDHCGDCAQPCVADTGEIPICRAGSCESACDQSAGFADCTGDGDCTDLQTDPDHCGSCGRDCPTGECTDGTCAPPPCSDETDEDQPFGGGAGTPDDPYVLCSPVHLQNLAETDSYLDAHFAIAEDIDFENLPVDATFPSIGSFDGTFDGFGHTISNLVIETDDRRAGLFEVLSPGATASNLVLDNLDVDHTSAPWDSPTGGIAARNYGTITNVEVDGRLQGDVRTGGIDGSNAGLIEHSSSTATVESPSWGWGIGGLAGENSGQIRHAVSQADVDAVGQAIGGAVGYNGGILFDLVTDVDIYVDATEDDDVLGIGGLAGYHEHNGALLEDAEVTGEIVVDGRADRIGGVAGYVHHGAIIEKVTVDDIAVEGASEVGGIAGLLANSELRDSSVSGEVHGRDEDVGGAVGHLIGHPTVEDVDSSADVSSEGPDDVGGLVGYAHGANATIRDAHVSGDVTTDTADRVGGLVGRLVEGASVTDSEAVGSVEVDPDEGADHSGKIVGGLVGHLEDQNPSTVVGSRVAGSVSVTDPEAVAVGGLVGIFEGHGHIAESSSTADVDSTATDTGGLVGWLRWIDGDNDEIRRSFATGDVTAQHGNTGGLVGRANTNADVVDSYATGDATDGDTVGSMFGNLNGTARRCYSIGEPLSVPVGNHHTDPTHFPRSFGMRADPQDDEDRDWLLTQEQFGEASHFADDSDDDWDLDEVWTIVEADDLQADDEQIEDEFTRPRLQWEFED